MGISADVQGDDLDETYVDTSAEKHSQHIIVAALLCLEEFNFKACTKVTGVKIPFF